MPYSRGIRQRLAIASNGVRLIHGEADGLPGLVVDQYADVLSAQFLSTGAERWKGAIADALVAATGTVARTVTNVRAGARSPVAGMVHALTVLVVMLVAAPLALHVPLAALAGILLFVAWNMGEWREFGRLRHFSLHYRTILVGTFVLTVVFVVTVAVEVGLVLACVFFIWRMSTLFRVEPPAQVAAPEGVTVFELYGSLFFGAVGKIEALPAQLPEGTRAVVLEMHRMISMDTSGLEALGQLHRSLQRRGMALVLVAVTEQPLSLMQRSGFAAELGTQHIVATLEAAWATVPTPR